MHKRRKKDPIEKLADKLKKLFKKRKKEEGASLEAYQEAEKRAQALAGELMRV